jgi:signal transduction histidine kinase
VKARQQGEKALTTIEGENEFAQLGEAFNEMLRVSDSVDHLKSEFVSTVSHELRTPLTSIRGAVGLALGSASNELPEKVTELLVMANRNIDRLTLLVNDILDLEKIESGRLAFKFEPLDLVELTRNALESNAGYAHQHQVRLRLVGSPTRAGVKGDESRLLQVFANLLSNAIKYSPAGGEVEVSIQQRGDRFRVEVQDHGTGIPEAFRARIFQRFAQADSSDTREKGGTGLGLNISKVIVERHEGVIGYESQQGVGTEFYFELPVRTESRESAA